MADLELMGSFISTIGFPIVSTLILGYLLIQEKKDHKEEIKELTSAIHSNTLIMTELKQLLQDIRDEH